MAAEPPATLLGRDIRRGAAWRHLGRFTGESRIYLRAGRRALSCR